MKSDTGRGLVVATVLVWAAGLIWAVGAAPAAAQGLSLGGGRSDLPIEIDADNGIEWQQQKLIFVARGNARARRGDLTVEAETLRAYYRERKDGSTDIWRLDAEGDVKISTPGETAYGQSAVYNVDDGTLVLKGGKKVRLVTQQDEITADQQLEYWEKKQMAVARGNALAVRADRRLAADILVAYFRPDKNGKNSIHRIEAFDNVRIVTAKDTASGDRGEYDVESGIATLTGSVRITRGNTRLKGCRAKVNMNTGVSRLFGCGSAASGGQRVRGLIHPGSRLGTAKPGEKNRPGDNK